MTHRRLGVQSGLDLAETFPIRFGRYELVERLAVGGMAELFLATVPGEHGFAKNVVIKRLLPHLAREQGYTAMFIDEAKLTARLVHPKIAQTYELGRVGDQLFIAMEMVDGVDVLALLREYASRHDRLPADVAVWVAHEVLDALDYAHALTTEDGEPLGVVHRDISPSNILLSRRGDVKLVDFGIARASEPNRHHRTKSGTLKGKYGYMSPEQVLEQQVDRRSDLFSVGIVMAEMLMGRRLFAAPNELDVLLMVRDARLGRLDEHGKHIEPDLDAILRKALRKDPDERWKTAGEMRDALDEWLFQQRMRVNPKKVGDMVDSVYDAVWTRRRASLAGGLGVEEVAEASPPAAPSSARAPTTIETPRAQRPSTAPDAADGIPRGTLGGTDSLPIISVEETPAPLEIAPPAQRPRPVVKIPPKEPPAPGKPKAATPVARVTPRAVQVPPKATTVPPPPAAAPAVAADDELDRAFADLGLDEPAAPPAPPPRAETVDPFADLAIDLDLPVDEEAPTPVPLSPQPSVRYSSIEAAVSALSKKPPDPSTVDLDGQLVGGGRRSQSMPALTHADVERAASSPPPVVVSDIEDTPEESGDFATIPPLKVLWRLLSGKRTGLLVCRVGAINKDIYVRDGIPEYVSSNISSELFGNYLVAQGVLSQGELAMALAMMPHYGGKLGDTLVGLGLLKPLEVFRHLTRQVRQKLIDVCTWSKGQYSWHANRVNEREAFPLDLNAFEVLGAGAMALPESVTAVWFARSRELKLRARAGALPDRFEVAGLRGLYDTLDGRRKVADVVQLHDAGEERHRAIKMLMLLELCELARAV